MNANPFARGAAIAAPITLLVLFGIARGQQAPPPNTPSAIFQTGDACLSCHNGITTPAGEDVSIGTDWRATMMANSARDPYWHAAVRREVVDHPTAQAEIENECSTCHMPMASYETKEAGGFSEVFAHLPVGRSQHPFAALAADGVSCTVCHQIEEEGLGDPSTFTGRFHVDTTHPWELRRMFGPFAVDTGRVTLMRSATAYTPTEATHIQQSELCASCHTLYTHSLGPSGETLAEFPEQVPYLEWLHSDYQEEQSCQSCHMPVVQDSIPLVSVLAQARSGFSRHTFEGGNFFMIRMLNRYRMELGVASPSQEMDRAAARAVDHLQTRTASLSFATTRRTADGVEVVLDVENLAGHKLPTGYPSRRVWLRVAVTDASGRTVFESGALRPDGSIAGNDNDADPGRYEPHHTEISRPDQVQIYESILGGPDRSVTTGLLTAVVYLKDNRILPRGFDKGTAEEDIAVQGGAADDPTFVGGSDRISYRVATSAAGPLRVVAELWYQPIGFRWADNLRAYRTVETDRFVGYFDEMSGGSATRITVASTTID